MSKNSEIYEVYLKAMLTGDQETAGKYIADAFTFNGPILKTKNKKEFFENVSPDLAAMTRGYNILQQDEAGDEICTLFEYNIETPVDKGAVYMVEWNKVRDGQLVSGKLVFDSAEFNALMPS